MKKDISNELLNRYLKGECTPEEEALVDEWYASFDSHQNDKRLLNMFERKALEKKMLQRIKSRLTRSDIHHHEHENLPAFENKKRTFILYRAAAVIVLAIAFGIGVYKLVDISPGVHLTEQIIKIENLNHSIARQQLPDGTVLWLQPNSRVEYPAEFRRAKRELTLTGEAFFDVARDAERPFIITTGNITTRVLGTSFNIKAYDHSTSIEVSVLTGKVFVALTEKTHGAANSNSVTLTPQQRVTYVKKDNRLEKDNAAQLPELNIWSQLDIVFENARLQDVIVTLEEKFDVAIEAKNPNLLNCIIRADFTNQNLPDILEMLSKSVEATYEIRDGTILLKGDGCVN